MKKILILANSSGGLYDFRNELVLRLLKSYEVVVSLPDDVRTRELAEEGCRVIHTAINRRGVNPKEDISLLLSYRRLIQDEKPDLVLTYTIKPNIYGGFCSRMARVPYVETVTGLGSSFEKKGLFLHMIVAMYRTALKKAECIFFQNEENRQIFESYHIRGKQTKLVSGLRCEPETAYDGALPGRRYDCFSVCGPHDAGKGD
ncbi:MAG: glycosyltransferase [Lachnospiraceae bacterium]